MIVHWQRKAADLLQSELELPEAFYSSAPSVFFYFCISTAKGHDPLALQGQFLYVVELGVLLIHCYRYAEYNLG